MSDAAVPSCRAAGVAVDCSAREALAAWAPAVLRWRDASTPPAGEDSPTPAALPDLGPRFEYLPRAEGDDWARLARGPTAVRMWVDRGCTSGRIAGRIAGRACATYAGAGCTRQSSLRVPAARGRGYRDGVWPDAADSPQRLR